MQNQTQPLNQLKKFSSIGWSLLDVLLPPFCSNCGTFGYELCAECQKQIEVINQNNICPICGGASNKGKTCKTCIETKPHFDQLRAWGVYSGVLREVIQKVKFNRGIGLVRYLVEPGAYFINEWGIRIDHIVPVPLTQARHQIRGYNQASLIAKPISKQLRIPFKPKAISRIKETKSQVGLKRVEREENVLGAFESDLLENQNKSVLVIDDITTTGSTLNECARALKKSGAKEVYCFAIAKTPFNKNQKEQEVI